MRGTTEEILQILIESKWNLKSGTVSLPSSSRAYINRIKVEFKEGRTETRSERKGILIESKWNLKKHTASDIKETFNILIESKWNLKTY